MKKLLLILTIFCLAALSFADGWYDKYQSAKRDLVYIEKSKKVTLKSYDLVARKFYNIYSASPDGSLADDSLHYTAQTYYKSYKRFGHRDDLLKTLKHLKLLAVNYNTRLASLAYLQSADIYIKERDYPSARFMLNRLLSKFPDSEDADSAKRRMAVIEKKFGRNLVALPEKKNDKPVQKTANTASLVPIFEKKDGKVRLETKEIEVKDNSPTYFEGDDTGVAIKDIRHFSAEDYTRVVIDLNGNPGFEKHWLREDPEHNKPPRLYLDVKSANVSESIPNKIPIKDGLLSSIRWGKYKPGVTRIVLDSANVKDFTVFRMENPDRIVVDVSGETSKLKQVSAPLEGNIYLNKNNDAEPSTLAGVFGLKIRRIVIDPGHGGKDPGATYYGIKEKDVVLDVAKRLKAEFKKNPDLQVFMTRETDVFIPLEERTAFANRMKADIFISIHVNASKNRRTQGVETYVLNVTKDKKALAVAAKENQATRKSMSDLQGILKDIMLNSKLEESLQLADYAQKALLGSLYRSARYSRGVKQAPFYVLVGAQMPSILIETGFISNKDEAKKFRTASYRKKVASSIYKGLIRYILAFNGNNIDNPSL